MENDVRDTIQNENAPLVSISVIAYNHEKYIRQCLDGILMQNVNFPYEILIHDDASPDGTADIIREYEAKYPDIIKPIYQTENQFSKVGVGAISRFNDERARGKYIAQCEGDDYWTDPGKLQMQVDFLEAHPEYVGTAHNVRCVNELGEEINPSNFCKIHPDYTYTINDVEKRILPGHINSLLFRNIFLSLSDGIKNSYYSCNANGDEKLPLLLTLYGDIWCSKGIMSVYRRISRDGSTNLSSQRKSWDWNYYGYLHMLELAKFAKNNYDVTLDLHYISEYNTARELISCLYSPTKEHRNNLNYLWKHADSKSNVIYYLFLIIPKYAKQLIKKWRT